MIIHVVQPSETIYSIANLYDISASRLILDNNITEPNNLVIGDTIVVLFPAATHEVQDGDTLESIATAYDVSIMQLLRNNPFLSFSSLRVGDTLVISYTDEKIMDITTNGYTFPFIDMAILRKTLPFLTYLTIFNYQITNEGELIDIDDEEIIQLAKEYFVAPIMLLTTLDNDGTPDKSTMHTIVNNEELQNGLIDNTINIMKQKGYYGLNIDTPYITSEDREQYILFIEKFANRIKEEGYEFIITISPNTFVSDTSTFYQGAEYASLGQLADQIMLISYEWGYLKEAPLGVMPYNVIKAFIDYAVSLIPFEKLSFAIPTIGYIVELPIEEGKSTANSISIDFAIDLAREVGAIILFDEITQTPFYEYTIVVSYLVWFKDARSINALMQFVPTYGLKGVGLWNIMRFYASFWLVINSQYEIIKIL